MLASPTDLGSCPLSLLAVEQCAWPLGSSLQDGPI